MRPLARGARAGIFAGILAWHALVVLILLRQRVAVSPTPEAVMTWLKLEEPRPQPPPLVSPSPVPAGRLSRNVSPPRPPAPSVAPEPGSTAITIAPKVDWYGQAARAARDQYADRLHTPAALDTRPKAMELPATEVREHKRGDQENLGNGQWRVWLSARCSYIQETSAPPTPNQIRVASLHCVPKPPAIETAGLERRRPLYLEPPIALPRKGKVPNAPRAGPAMGGSPGR